MEFYMYKIAPGHFQIHVISLSSRGCGFDFNTLRPQQNDRQCTVDEFNGIFLNENVRISIKTSLQFIPISPMNNMAWRQTGDKPLLEPMMV